MHHYAPSNACLRSLRRLDVFEQRVRAVFELHDHALERLHRGLDLEQPQHDGLVGPEQLARRDAVDERVSDLPGCAGDRSREEESSPCCRGYAAPVWLCRTGVTPSRCGQHLSRAVGREVEQHLARLPELGQPLRRPVAVRRPGRDGRAARAVGTGRDVGSLDRHARPQAEHLHRPPALGRDPAPGSAPFATAGAPGAKGWRPGTPWRSRRTSTPAGSIGRRSASSIARKAMERADGGRRGRGHDRADDLGIRTTVAVELEDDLRRARRRASPTMPVPRTVEAVVSVWSR